MIDVNIKCDRCSNLILRSRNKYYMDNDDYYKTSSNEKHMAESVKDGFNYNILIRFSYPRFKPNVNPRILTDFNGFILCEDCLGDLEKFIMEANKK